MKRDFVKSSRISCLWNIPGTPLEVFAPPRFKFRFTCWRSWTIMRVICSQNYEMNLLLPGIVSPSQHLMQRVLKSLHSTNLYLKMIDHAHCALHSDDSDFEATTKKNLLFLGRFSPILVHVTHLLEIMVTVGSICKWQVTSNKWQATSDKYGQVTSDKHGPSPSWNCFPQPVVGEGGPAIAVTAGISLAKEDRSSALAAKGGWPAILG